MIMKKRHLSLKSQIILDTLIPLILVSCILCIVFASFFYHSITENARKQISNSIEKLSVEVNAILAPSKEMIYDLAASAKEFHNPKDLYKIVKLLNIRRPETFALYYTTLISRFEPNGFYVDSSDWNPDSDWIPPQRPWFIAAREKPNTLVLVDPYVDAMTKQLCITMAHSVQDNNGNLLGVAAADLAVDNISKAVKEIKLSDNCEIHLVDSTGLYITHDDLSCIMTKNYFDNSELGSLGYSASNYLNGKSDVFFLNGRYYAVTTASSTPWFIVAEGPISDFTSQMNSFIRILVMILVILTLFFMLLAIFFSRRITFAFRQLVNNCKRLSAGDFTGEYKDFFTKEASDLSIGFETFSASISSIVKKIRNASGSITKSSQLLAQTAGAITQSVLNTTNSLSSMTDTFNSEQNAVMSVQKAISDIASETQSLSVEIQKQNDQILTFSKSIAAITNRSSSVQTGTESVVNHIANLVTSATADKERISNSAREIQEIKEESGTLLEMNTVISNVASQTNLLAMNAAIEAAHAGAAGKGFAVVADEIRKLAETTAKQAQSSSSALQKIQKEIDAIVDSSLMVENSFIQTIAQIEQIAQFASGLQQSSVEQNKEADNISSAITVITESSERVKNNTKVITTSMSNASNICNTLVQMSTNVSSNLQQCTQSVTYLNTTADQVSSVANESKTHIENLEETVKTFIIR